MDMLNKLKEINQRWDINEVQDPKERFLGFKKRVVVIFANIDSLITKEGIKHFCNIFGIAMRFMEDKSINIMRHGYQAV